MKINLKDVHLNFQTNLTYSDGREDHTLKLESIADDGRLKAWRSVTTYISVDDLIEAGYLIGNDSGLLTDPTDSSKNLNDTKVRLEYDADKNNVTATVVD